MHSGLLASKAGKVRLLKPSELESAWSPKSDRLVTAWEAVHHLIKVLEADGETAAGNLVRRLGASAEISRELAYRLYALSERKRRAAEALSYNGLVMSWPEIARLARDGGKAQPTQAQLFEEG